MTTAALPKTVTIRARIAVAAAAVSSVLAFASAPTSAAVGGVEQAAGGPPPWVVAGTRITHYSSVATLAAGTYELVEDPNGPLLDPVTGKRYRESYTSATGQVPAGGSTTSGDGFWEVTVAAVDGENVVVARSYVGNEPLTGTRSVAFPSSERVAGAEVALAWIRPDRLATMKTGDVPNQLVLRGQITAGGQTYDAVSVVNPIAGNYSLVAYDSVTGVMLYSALRMSDLSGGPLQMGLMELRGQRQLTIPGIGAAVPDWVTRHPELVYAGTQELGNSLEQTSTPMTFPPITVPLSWRTKITQSGATWAMFETTLTVNVTGSPTSVTSSGVTSGAGPYWWDPTALAGMTAGQVLDTDPHTGMTITASQVVQGPSGPAVVIVQSMPGYQLEARYDVGTGVMLAQTEAVTSTGYTTRIELQQMPT